MAKKLRSKQKERLYWGQFSHGSKIVQSGIWAEKCPYICDTYEPLHEKTNNLHMRKQRRRSAN